MAFNITITDENGNAIDKRTILAQTEAAKRRVEAARTASKVALDAYQAALQESKEAMEEFNGLYTLAGYFGGGVEKPKSNKGRKKKVVESAPEVAIQNVTKGTTGNKLPPSKVIGKVKPKGKGWTK